MKHLFAFALFYPAIISMAAAQNFNIRYFSQANQNLYGSTLLRTGDGGYMVVTDSYCYTPGAITFDGCPIALRPTKTNSAGDSLWSGLIYHDNAYGVAVYEQSDGSYALFQTEFEAGSCLGIGVGGGGGGGLKKGKGYHLTAPGTLISTRTYQTQCDLPATGTIALDNDQKLMLANYDEPVLFVSPNRRAEFYRLDADNNAQLIKTYPGTLFYNAQMARVENTQFVMAYSVDNSYEFRLAKLDNTANFIWTHTYTNIPQATGYPLQLRSLSNGDLGLLTIVYDNNGIASSRLMRFNAAGDFLWSKDFAGGDGNFSERPDGKLLIAYTVGPYAEQTAFVSLLNAAGDSLNGRNYDPGAGSEMASEIVATGSNSFALLGTARCCNLDTATGPSQAFVLFDQFNTVNTQEQDQADFSVTVYPNSAQNELFFQMKNAGVADFTLQLHDATGKMVREGFFSSDQIRIDRKNLPAGLYFFSVRNKSGMTCTGKVTMQ